MDAEIIVQWEEAVMQGYGVGSGLFPFPLLLPCFFAGAGGVQRFVDNGRGVDLLVSDMVVVFLEVPSSS